MTDHELHVQVMLMNIPIQPARGDVVAGKIAAILDQPPEVIASLREAAQ